MRGVLVIETTNKEPTSKQYPTLLLFPQEPSTITNTAELRRLAQELLLLPVLKQRPQSVWPAFQEGAPSEHPLHPRKQISYIYHEEKRKHHGLLTLNLNLSQHKSIPSNPRQNVNEL